MVAGRLAMEEGVPLVSPTATDARMLEIDPRVYTVNALDGAIGHTIGTYAATNLERRRFAILAVDDAYGRIQADAFAADPRMADESASAAPLMMAWVMGVARLTPHEAFMPTILAFHLCQISAAGALVLLADMPGMTSDVLDRLIASFGTRPEPRIVLPTVDGRGVRLVEATMRAEHSGDADVWDRIDEATWLVLDDRPSVDPGEQPVLLQFEEITSYGRRAGTQSARELGHGAVVFGDGIEADSVALGWGQTVTIGRAPASLNVVR